MHCGAMYSKENFLMTRSPVEPGTRVLAWSLNKDSPPVVVAFTCPPANP